MSESASAATLAPWSLAWRLGFGQLVAWGVLYYAFTVAIGPMQVATGWTRSFLNSGMSLGLLAWGLCAYPVGVWIHRRGARELMAISSVIGGISLASLGVVTSPLGYGAAWLFLGAAMAGLLYEPAFAVITEHFAQHYRRGITVVTLVGGLASTAFIPAANFYVERFGWCDALIGLGLFQALVGGAWHWFVVPARARCRAIREADERGELKSRASLVEWRDRRFAGLAVWFAAHAATFSGTILLLVPVLQASAVPSATMLQAIVLIGPMQVIGRLALAGWTDRLSSLQVGRWVTLLLVLALGLVSVFPPTTIVLLLFSTLYGAANGVTTILRGTVVAELFGRDRYPVIAGALSLPSVLAKAAAPLVCAAIWDGTGSARSVFVTGLLFAILGAAGMRWAARASALAR